MKGIGKNRWKINRIETTILIDIVKEHNNIHIHFICVQFYQLKWLTISMIKNTRSQDENSTK